MRLTTRRAAPLAAWLACLAFAAQGAARPTELRGETRHGRRRANETSIANLLTADAREDQDRRGPAGRGKCEPGREFHCKLEDRCLPIELRCDFIGHCLDGEDELECAPEWCGFDHDQCHWLNGWLAHDEGGQGDELRNDPERLSGRGGGDGATLWAPERDLWRRRPAEGRRRAMAGRAGLEPLLGRLGAEFVFVALPASGRGGEWAGGQVALGRRAGLRAPQVGRTSPMCQLRFEYALWPGPPPAPWGSNGSAAAIHQKHHSRECPRGPRLARLETTIGLVARVKGGQRRSLWRRHVDWAPAEQPAAAASTGTGPPKGPQIDYQSPRRVAREQAAAAAPEQQHGEHNHDEEPHDKLARPWPERELDWMVGVAELGHLELAELAFEVESRSSFHSATCEPTPPVPQKRNLMAGGQAKAANEHAWDDSPFLGSLVALKWLKFQSCRDWPRLDAEPAREMHDDWDDVEFGDEEESDEGQSYDEDYPGEAAHGAGTSAESKLDLAGGPTTTRPGNRNAGGTSPRAARPESTCEPTSEFECPGGACLARERLCNFVSECAVHPAAGMAQLGMESSRDDESHDLCASILGRETFEGPAGSPAVLPPTSPAVRLPASAVPAVSLAAANVPAGDPADVPAKLPANVPARVPASQTDDHTAAWRYRQMFPTGHLNRFWRLDGNWTLSRVGVRQNRRNQAHLPRSDHTTRTSGGSFLSLELPLAGQAGEDEPAAGSAPASPFQVSAGRAPSSQHNQDEQAASRLYFVAVRSQWMQKLEGAECRLKFFYNLVSSAPPAGSGRTSFAAEPEGVRLALAVEHYVLRSNFSSGNSQTNSAPANATTQQERLEHQVDAYFYTNQRLEETSRPSARRSSPVEFPGVDFWREVNLEIGPLAVGEPFLIRLMVYVELSSQVERRLRELNERATLNLDDLSTHFGCGPLEDEPRRERLEGLIERHWLARGRFVARDYLEPLRRADQPLVEREPSPPPPHKFEPKLRHKWEYFWPNLRHGGRRRSSGEGDSTSGLSRWWPFGGRSTGDAEGQDGASDEGDDQGDEWADGPQQIEPQKLVACVLGALCLIMGLIALIVFVLVPHVERAMMSHQDQIQLSLSGEYSDLPVSHSSTALAENFLLHSRSGGSFSVAPSHHQHLRRGPPGGRDDDDDGDGEAAPKARGLRWRRKRSSLGGPHTRDHDGRTELVADQCLGSLDEDWSAPHSLSAGPPHEADSLSLSSCALDLSAGTDWPRGSSSSGRRRRNRRLASLPPPANPATGDDFERASLLGHFHQSHSLHSSFASLASISSVPAGAARGPLNGHRSADNNGKPPDGPARRKESTDSQGEPHQESSSSSSASLGPSSGSFSAFSPFSPASPPQAAASPPTHEEDNFHDASDK